MVNVHQLSPTFTSFHAPISLSTNSQNEGAWRPKWLIPLLGGRVCGGAEEASGGWTGGRGPVLPLLRCVAVLGGRRVRRGWLWRAWGTRIARSRRGEQNILQAPTSKHRVHSKYAQYYCLIGAARLDPARGYRWGRGSDMCSYGIRLLVKKHAPKP